MRPLFILLGLLNVALGVIGIFVPGMPTTVFLLVAGWFFARSSPRLYRWLHGHRHLGPYLEMARTRSMPVRARVVTIFAIWAGIGSSLLTRTDPGLWFALALAAAGLVGTAFVASMRGEPGRMRVQPGGPILR